MDNEHSACEQEIKDLKEKVEYYSTLQQNGYDARQRLMKEATSYKNALEEIASLTQNPKEYEPSLYTLNHIARNALSLTE